MGKNGSSWMPRARFALLEKGEALCRARRPAARGGAATPPAQGGSGQSRQASSAHVQRPGTWGDAPHASLLGFWKEVGAVQINITFRGMDSTDSLKSYVNKKIEHIARYFDRTI